MSGFTGVHAPDLEKRAAPWGWWRRYVTPKSSQYVHGSKTSEVYKLPGVAESQRLSVGEVTIAPGQRKPPTGTGSHRADEEVYFFVSGSGICTVGEAQIPGGQGDCVLIPPGVAHAVENTGEEPRRYIYALSWLHERA